MAGRRPIRNERDALKILTQLKETASTTQKVDFGALCFGPQRKFVEDPSRFVTGVCGRRAGKTDGTGLKALRTASRIPYCQIPYITNTRPQAKRIIWPKLQFWDRVLDLGAKFNQVELTMTLKNGSVIMLGGANDDSEIERYRGGAYPLVIIDEAQSVRSYLKVLVEEILAPATIDYAGQIVMIGTPNASAMGYFHDASTGKLVRPDTGKPIWSNHSWTGLDNPNIDEAYRKGKHDDIEVALKNAAREFENTRILQGLEKTDPRYLRETLGKWVRDEEGLVFQVPGMAIIEEMPEGDWSYVLGVDVGYVDATAFVVLAYSAEQMRIVVVESFQRTEMIPSAVAAEVDRLVDRWGIESVVVDPGGGGKAYVEEMKQRFQLPAKVAQKKAKVANIEMLNGDMKAGVVQVLAPTNQSLLHDASLLQWDYTRVDRRAGPPGAEGRRNIDKSHLMIDDRTPDHLLDAWLYGYRECKTLYDPQEEGPRPGTRAWQDAEEAAMLERARRKAAGNLRSDQAWWEAGF